MSSNTWSDDLDLDSIDYDSAEDFDDSESDEESRSSDARRRRVAAAQARRAQARAAMRGRRPAPRPTTPRAAVSAIRSLDLDNKVQEDRFRSAMAASSRRMSRSEYAAVTSAAVNQFIETFAAPDNPYFKAALRFAPLLLLTPQRRGTGVEAFVRDPRVVGGAAVAAITVVGANRARFTQPTSIDVLVPTALRPGQSQRLVADVRDGLGRDISGAKVTWSSDEPAVADITGPEGDHLLAKSAGSAVLTATSGSIRQRVRVSVEEAPPAGGAVASLNVQALTPEIAVGGSQTLKANALDSLGAVVPDAPIEWMSDDESTATVDSTGKVTGVGKGSVFITARSGNYVAHIPIVVK